MISYSVHRIKIREAKPIIETWHYSHSVNGIFSDYCYGLYDGNTIIGACIYGKPAMAGQWKKYTDNPESLRELRRLAIIDDTPKNTESWFISRTLKDIRKHGITTIISYADCNQGHEGIIYKASNFTYLGKTSPGRVIVRAGKVYHDKAIRTKYKGELKPFAKQLKEDLEQGKAKYHKTVGKNIYLYQLR